MASLVGARLPDIALQAHDGSSVNFARSECKTVVFCYPFTGRLNHPNPPGWDDIPGAHGSTPQALSFSRIYGEFEKLNVKIYGLSLLASEWQLDFAKRNGLPYLLLSDETQSFTGTMQLDTFTAGHTTYLARRSMFIENGTVIKDIFPVPDPEANAAHMLSLTKS